MSKQLSFAVAVALACFGTPTSLAIGEERSVISAASAPTIAGWIENGWLGDPPIKVKVKLDTGAKTSSINSPHYREFEQGGRRHVSFTLISGSGHEIDIVQPIVRTVTIRRAGVGKRSRPVILLKICVAGITSEVEFTLADRSEMTYPVLIGRSFLANKILVDSGRTFIGSGLCTKP